MECDWVLQNFISFSTVKIWQGGSGMKLVASMVQMQVSYHSVDFPSGSVGEESCYNAGDPGSIPVF